MKRRWVLCFALLLLLWNRPSNTTTDWNEFVFREGKNWTVRYTDRQTVASIYGRSSAASSSAEQAASEFLKSHHRLLGVASLADLRQEEFESSDLGFHFYYQQYFSGFPVIGGRIGIHVNRQNLVIAATSEVQPVARISSEQIASTVRTRKALTRLFQGNESVSFAELAVLPMSETGRIVWVLDVDSKEISRGSWRVYADASRPGWILRAVKTHATFEGKGNVFLENPVVTPKRTVQKFLNMDGSKKISGRFSNSLNANGDQTIDSPSGIDLSDFTTSSDPNRNFAFAENDIRLPEAMAYFHVNRVHDQWRKFGFTKLNAKAPIFVNLAETEGGPGLDNAFYSRSNQFRKTGIYAFGAGNQLENLGLDGDVYYHEYGHGVLDKVKPGLFATVESNYPGSFHEAFGDISAAAITGNSKLAEFGLRLKRTKRFVGRNIDNTNRFPQDVILRGFGRSEVHHTGLIAGGCWWDLQETAGAEPAQRILFKALPLLPDEMNFFDLQKAMLTSDANINSGANRVKIESAFLKHGITGKDPGQPGRLVVGGLKTGLLTLIGNVRLEDSFRVGDVIVVLANYNAIGVTPGYNIIPVDLDITGPSSDELFPFLLVDEAVKGRHTGARGALQLAIFTDFVTTPGTHKVKIQSRLGGTSRLSEKRTVSFEIR